METGGIKKSNERTMNKKLLKNLFISVTIFLAFIGTITIIYYMWISSLKQEYSGIPARQGIAETDSSEIKKVQTDLSLKIPSEIYGTDNLIFTIGFEQKINSRVLISKSYYPGSANVNIVVFNKNLNDYKLVFDEPVKVESIDYPTSQSDSAQNFILYNCISNDNDSSGTLDSEDNRILFLSDLNGKNLVQITPDSLNVTGHKIMEEFSSLFISLEDKKYNHLDANEKGNRKKEFLLWYDLNERRLIKQDILKSILDDAGKVFSGD